MIHIRPAKPMTFDVTIPLKSNFLIKAKLVHFESKSQQEPVQLVGAFYPNPLEKCKKKQR